MNYNDVRHTLAALNCTISGEGRVQDNSGRVYGTLGRRVFTPGQEGSEGEPVALEDIQSMDVMLSSGQLRLRMGEGESVKVNPQQDIYNIMVPREFPKFLYDMVDALPIIFPEADSCLYYDELKERDMIDMALLGRPEEGIVPIDDDVIPLLIQQAQKNMLEKGFVGKRFPADAIILQALQVFTYDRKRNLFLEWVQSHEWDGKPRLRTWFQDTFGATAPVLRAMGRESEYLSAVAEAWFMGAIRRQFHQTKHEIVPVFISSQGMGKGSALKYTAGADAWYKETLGKLSKTAEFLDSIRGRVIVELSESAELKTKNVDLVKGFISQDCDQYRKPYRRFEATYPRRFILAASSNTDTIFVDQTGNRRFFPIYCDPDVATREFSLDRKVGQYDVEQLWAEALHMYNNGGKWYLESELADLAAIVQSFSTVEDSDIEMIDAFLDEPENGFTHVGARISREMIMSLVYGIDVKVSPVPKDIEECYRKWTNAQNGWVTTGKAVRIGGKVVRAYERTTPPGEVAAIKHLKIVSSSKMPIKRRVDPETQEPIGPVEDGPVVPKPVSEKSVAEDELRVFLTRNPKIKVGDMIPHGSFRANTASELEAKGYLSLIIGPRASRMYILKKTI